MNTLWTMGDLALLLALVFVSGANLACASRITAERVPMRWGLDGRPTWYASKSVGLWLPVLFAVATRAGVYAAQVYTPDKIHGLNVGLAGFAIVIAATHVFLLRRWVKE